MALRINPLLVFMGLGVVGLAASGTDEPESGPELAPAPGSPPPPPPPQTPPGELVVVDYRDLADSSKRWENRTFEPVGVTLHQMGVSRSADPDDLTGVAGHFVLMRDGRVLWLHNLDKRVKNSAYSDMIQIEVEGNFQSTRGKWWRGSSGNLPMHTLNPAQARSLPLLLATLEPWLQPNSRGKFQLTGHRMAASKARRGNDPGPEIWTAVAPWALAGNWELGRLIGEGTAIPSSWYDYTAVQPLANA